MAAKNLLTKSDYLPYEEYLRLLKCLHEDKEYRIELYAILGFCTACRNSDIFAFKWEDILQQRLVVVEKKTKKIREISFNEEVQHKIKSLYCLMGQPNLKSLVFESGEGSGKNITIQHLNRQLKKIKVKYRLSINNFSTHTFRKTFGRYVYESNGRSAESLVLLNSIFKHASLNVTKTYIGITQDEIDQIYNLISL